MDTSKTDNPIIELTLMAPIIGKMIMVIPKIIASKLINLVFIFSS